MSLTSKIAQYIFDNTVGCRMGTVAEKAAYAFMDITGNGQDGQDPPPSMSDMLAFLKNPNQPPFEPRWDERLWNTCGYIVGQRSSGTVLLVSKAGVAGERYLFSAWWAKGDRYSFRKGNLPPDAQTLATLTYGPDNDGMTTVEKLYANIMTSLKDLSGG